MFRYKHTIILIICLLCTTYKGWTQDTLQFKWGAYNCNATALINGQPELPIYQTLLVLNSNETPKIEILSDEISIQVTDTIIPPHQPSYSKSSIPPGYTIDEKIYNTDDFYKLPLAKIEPLGICMGKPLARLTIAPIEYNPTQSKIKIHKNLSIRIDGLDNSSNNEETRNVALGYLIVSRPEFKSSLEPFIRWKQQMGYLVNTLYVDTADASIIYQQIHAFFENPTMANPAPHYILIVGDVDRIEGFSGRNRPSELNNHKTDFFYAEHTGDYLPDAIIGRMSVSDSNELQTVIAKTIAYEKGTFNTTDYLQRALIVAGRENTRPAPTTTNGQVNYVKQILFQLGLDTNCYYNPESENQLPEILQKLEDGNAIVNYTSHCTNAGWRNPSVTTTTIDTLLQEAKPALYVNNCCLSNQFQSDCFGEHLLRRPYGGAIGVIGASNETLWNEDYYWSVGAKAVTISPAWDRNHPGAFDAIINHPKRALTQGELLLAGNLAVTQYGSGYYKFYWEIYCLLGDPSLTIRTQAPTPTLVNIIDTVEANSSELTLQGTPFAKVTIIRDSSILGLTTLDSMGYGHLRLTLPFGDNSAIMTSLAPQCSATIDTLRANLTPHQLTINNYELRTQEGERIDYFSGHDTALLRLTIKSIDTITNHIIKIYQDLQDSLDGAVVDIFNSVLTIDTLFPQQQENLTIPLAISQGKQQPFAHLHVTISNASETYCELPISLEYRGAKPTWKPIEITQNGSSCTRLMHNQPYQIQMGISNTSLTMLDSAFTHIKIIAQPDSVTLFENSQYLDTLTTISSDINIPNTSTHLDIHRTIDFDGLETSDTQKLLIGKTFESFESGNFESYPWNVNDTDCWRIDTLGHQGHYCARSGQIADGQRSKLALPIWVINNDSIGFWAKTSCQNVSDKLIFSIDGGEKKYFSGEHDWSYWKTTIAKGFHLLEWTYAKNESTSQGEDCVWIDDIQLPLAQWDNSYGISDTVCPTQSVNISPIFQSEITIYPNPTSKYFWIDNPTNQNATIVIYDMLGHEIDNFVIESQSCTQYYTYKMRLGIFTIVINKTPYRIIITE